MKINTIGIIGRGALGVTYADKFISALGTANVRFIADRERIERYKTDGLTLNGKPCDFSYAADDFIPDLLIFAVKSTGFDSALSLAKNHIGKNTILVSVMNGLDSERLIGERYGTQNLLYCVVQGMDIARYDASVSYSVFGEFFIGTDNGEGSPALTAFAELLSACVVKYTIERDIIHRIWSKFMINVGVNQATHAYECDYGEVQKPNSEARSTMLSAMREVMLVAKAEGVALTQADFDGYVKIIDSIPPDKCPSMRQDGIEKRASEVEIFGGAMLRLGKKHNIPLPANQWLYDRITALDKRNVDVASTSTRPQ